MRVRFLGEGYRRSSVSVVELKLHRLILVGGGKVTSDKCWRDLVVAILSVNNYPIEKTLRLSESLERNGLFDVAVLAANGLADIGKRLGEAGYNRGAFMHELFTQRLCSLGRLASDVSIEDCEKILRSGTRKDVSILLSKVNGIGPNVLASYFVLRGSQ
jgi:hypothetical protein